MSLCPYNAGLPFKITNCTLSRAQWDRAAADALRARFMAANADLGERLPSSPNPDAVDVEVDLAYRVHDAGRDRRTVRAGGDLRSRSVGPPLLRSNRRSYPPHDPTDHRRVRETRPAQVPDYLLPPLPRRRPKRCVRPDPVHGLVSTLLPYVPQGSRTRVAEAQGDGQNRSDSSWLTAFPTSWPGRLGRRGDPATVHASIAATRSESGAADERRPATPTRSIRQWTG